MELAHILQGRGYDIDPGRAQSYGEVPDVSGLPGIHMEVKRVERLNVSEAMIRPPGTPNASPKRLRPEEKYGSACG